MFESADRVHWKNMDGIWMRDVGESKNSGKTRSFRGGAVGTGEEDSVPFQVS